MKSYVSDQQLIVAVSSAVEKVSFNIYCESFNEINRPLNISPTE